MGLESGKNWWYTNFSSPTLTVQLGLGATDLSTDYWRLVYTNKALATAFGKANKDREKNAL